MNTLNLKKCAGMAVVAGLAFSTSSAVFALTKTNSATNIATIAEDCDIVAIGADLGIVITPVTNTAADNNPNTAEARGHVKSNADGETSGTAKDTTNNTNDDALTLDLGLPTTPVDLATPVATAISDALTAGTPGVYVACARTPTSVFIASGNPNSFGDHSGAKRDLGITTGAAVTFTGQMVQYTDATTTDATHTLGYTITYNPVVVDTTGLGGGLIPLPFIATYTSSATAVTTAGTSDALTPPPGDYADITIAEVNF